MVKEQLAFCSGIKWFWVFFENLCLVSPSHVASWRTVTFICNILTGYDGSENPKRLFIPALPKPLQDTRNRQNSKGIVQVSRQMLELQLVGVYPFSPKICIWFLVSGMKLSSNFSQESSFLSSISRWVTVGLFCMWEDSSIIVGFLI